MVGDVVILAVVMLIEAGWWDVKLDDPRDATSRVQEKRLGLYALTFPAERP